ncbi:hypothetical protein [Epilithonimonas sp.]|uniref:hypothetical protein n=1 Tax=Epilithonimonas sp. TaxID=2894511 RepID=UPI002FDDAA2B
MRIFQVLVFSLFSFYCSSQVKNDNIRFENNPSYLNLKFSLNQNINLSKQNLLIANNYFKKEINYFSTENSFTSKQETYLKDIEKPFAKSIIEGILNGILNNKN